MRDLITLSCPACGDKLQITEDIDRFAYVVSGYVHTINHCGGIVTQIPAIDSMMNMQAENTNNEGQTNEKILVIMFLLVLSVGSIGMSQVLADGLDQVYMPVVMNGLITTPVPTPTSIPTTTPAPNASPIFTNFYAWGSGVNYEGTIKNVGPRPNNNVVISVVARCSFGGISSSHSYITSPIQPGDTANFGSVVVIICSGNINVTASIESWVQQ